MHDIMWRGNGDGGGYGGFGGGGFGGGFGGGGGGGFDLPDGAMPAAPMGAFTRQFRAFPVSFIDRVRWQWLWSWRWWWW